MGLFSPRPMRAGSPIGGRDLAASRGDFSPQPMGGRDNLTTAYLDAAATGGTRQPPVRRYAGRQAGRRAQIW